MKKTAILVLAALLLALPILGLGETVTNPEVTEAPAATETPVWGMGRGNRWQQNQTTPPQSNFVDENQDGVCDTCGQASGQNPQAPGFVDENADGVCDHYGTDAQYQGRGRMMQGRMQGMQGRGAQAFRGRAPMGQGRVQGMRGHMGMMRNRMHRGQGQSFADANQDGVCDFFQNNTQSQPGGRFRNNTPQGPGGCFGR